MTLFIRKNIKVIVSKTIKEIRCALADFEYSKLLEKDKARLISKKIFEDTIHELTTRELCKTSPYWGKTIVLCDNADNTEVDSFTDINGLKCSFDLNLKSSCNVLGNSIVSVIRILILCSKLLILIRKNLSIKR